MSGCQLEELAGHPRPIGRKTKHHFRFQPGASRESCFYRKRGLSDVKQSPAPKRLLLPSRTSRRRRNPLTSACRLWTDEEMADTTRLLIIRVFETCQRLKIRRRRHIKRRHPPSADHGTSRDTDWARGRIQPTLSLGKAIYRVPFRPMIGVEFRTSVCLDVVDNHLRDMLHAEQPLKTTLSSGAVFPWA